MHLSTLGQECRDVVFPSHKSQCDGDSTTLAFVRSVLDMEEPDFVAFTGDQVDGDHAPNTKSVPKPME